MRSTTADRSFFALVATALVPYALLGLFGCGLLSVLAYRLGADGLDGLTRDGQDLRPAALLFAIVAAGTLVAGWSVYRQVLATRALAREVASRRRPLTAAVQQAADRAGVVSRVDLVDDAEPFSFTYGVLPPRVAISTGLVEAAGPDELAAVLVHERYHVRSADTAKVLVARAAPAAFFFLPALAPLRDRYLTGRELAADRMAVEATGQRALGGALLKVLGGPSWGDVGAAAALTGGALDHRVEQLERGAEPPLPRVPRRAVWLTLVAAGCLAGLVVWTVVAGGPEMVSMDGSRPRGAGGTMLAVVGSVACMGGMAAAVVLAVRRGTRHRRGGLTSARRAPTTGT